MKHTILGAAGVTVLLVTLGAPAQEQRVRVAEPETPAKEGPAPAGVSAESVVLRLIRYSGAVRDPLGQPRTGAVGITFAFYGDGQGGAPLWLETQAVALDEQGRYTVLLGAESNDGLPLELFASGQARWLGIQVQGEAEQPRVLLVSVPYALKAADAEMLGGRPASAFALAPSAAEEGESPIAPTKDVVTAAGTTNFVAKFTGTESLADSQIFDNATNVGIGTTSPTNKLQVNGSIRLLGQTTHQVQVTGVASSGRLGQDVNGFFFASDTAGKQLNFFTNAGAGIQKRLTVTGDGNVGIATTSPPTTKLEVNGSGKFTGNVSATGDVTATTLTEISSRRWKTNVQPLQGALEKVERLRGVSYQRVTDGRHDIGLIAEEVGAVVPEIVSYEGNGEDAKSLAYARLTALLVEAMKEQQAQIRELQSAIEAMKARVASKQ